MLAEKGDDAAWFRDGFAQRTIRACIPAGGKRSHPARQAARLDTQRHTIENMFGRLKAWRRLALRDDGCAHTVFSAIWIAAPGILGLSFTRPHPSDEQISGVLREADAGLPITALCRKDGVSALPHTHDSAAQVAG